MRAGFWLTVFVVCEITFWVSLLIVALAALAGRAFGS